MRAWAVLKKELRLYFSSPIAYAVLTIFSLVAGWFFYNVFAFYTLLSMQSAMNPMMAEIERGMSRSQSATIPPTQPKGTPVNTRSASTRLW